MKKCNLSDPTPSVSRLNMIRIIKDNCQLFPTMIQVLNGVCLSKSNISGRYILSGRATSSDDSLINANKAIMNNNAGYEVEASANPDSAAKSAFPQKLDDAQKQCTIGVDDVHRLTSKDIMSHNAGYVATNDKNFLKEITSDSINVPPVKRCIKCVGCKSCKKIHLPDQAR